MPLSNICCRIRFDNISNLPMLFSLFMTNITAKFNKVSAFFILFVFTMTAFSVDASQTTQTNADQSTRTDCINSQETILPTVLAYVGNKTITLRMVDDLSFFFFYLETQPKTSSDIEKFDPKLRRAASFVELMRMFLKINVCESFMTSKDGIPKAIINRYLRNLERNVKLPANIITLLMNNDTFSENVVLNYAKAKILWEYFVDGKRRKDLQITENEISQKLFLHQKFKDQQHFRLFEIFIPFYTLPQNFNVMMQQLQQLTNTLRGENGLKAFTAIAHTHSVAPSSKNAGDLGWIAKSQLPQFFQDQEKEPEINKLIGPLREDNGFRFFLIVAKQDKASDIDEYTSDDIISFLEIAYQIPNDATQEDISKINAELQYILPKIQNMKEAKTFQENSSRKLNIDLQTKSLNKLDISYKNILNALNESNRTSKPIIKNNTLLIYHLISKTIGNSNESLRKKIANVLMNQKIAIATMQEEQLLWTYSSFRLTDAGRKTIETTQL